MVYSIGDYIKFMRETGLFELLQKHIINNLYDYFVSDGGINGSFDISDPKVTTGYSYMFNNNPVELAVVIKDLCESSNINYHLVFNKIYSKSLIEKFDWAMNTPADYWKKFPNVK